MRLDSVECQNFFNHKYTKIDLTKVGSPVLIKGENGAGKSSLFTEALSFAVFGITRMPSPDEAIRNGSSEMSVGVQFNLNGQDVEIIRTKKRGKGAKLELVIDGEHVEELLTETQARIQKMFGLSYNSFLSSILLKQEDSDFFIRQKPDERKKIISEILDLGAYERIEKQAREKRAQLKNEIKIEEVAYNNITIKDSDELLNKNTELKALETRIISKIERMESELEDIRRWNHTVNEQISHHQDVMQANNGATYQISLLKNKINTAQNQITKDEAIAHVGNNQNDAITKAEQMIEGFERRCAELDEKSKSLTNDYNARTKYELSALSNEMEEPLRELNFLRSEIGQLFKQISELEKGVFLVCPTCNQDVDQSKNLTLIQEKIFARDAISTEISLKSLPLVELNKQKELLEKNRSEWQIEKLREIRDVDAKYVEAKTTLNTARPMLKKRFDQQREYEIAQQRVNGLKENILDWMQSVRVFEQQIRPVPVVTIEKKDETAPVMQLGESRKMQNDLVRAIATLDAEIEQNSFAIERKNQLEELLKNKVHDIALYEKIVVAFSKNGIPAAIIETVLPEIEQMTNHFLTRMSHGRLSIRFKTTEQMKNGNEKDTLDVEVFDGTEWRRFESFSGGEQFRISLSIRLALSKVLSRRANVDLQLLILDEAATSLDTQGREEFVQTVLSLGEDFSRIIIMSHIQELSDEFDNRITLTKTMDGTKVVSGT